MDKPLNLNQNLENKQILSPQLYLQLHLLNLNSIELYQYIKQKSEENPFIDIQENIIQPEPEDKNGKISVESGDDDQVTQKVYRNINGRDEDLNVIENTVSYKMNLIDYIEEYCDYYEIYKKDRENVLSLLYYLNPHGILSKDLAAIADELGMDLYSAENAKIILQSIEGQGIGSENYKELFLVQLHMGNYPQSSELYSFISNHWDDYVNHRWNSLQKKGLSLQRINDITDQLKNIIRLNPIEDYNFENTQYIIPDIIITYKQDDFTVKINNLFTLNYDNISLAKKEKNQNLIDKQNEIYYIKSALEKRDQLLKSFIQYFILYQQDFFYKGPEYIKSASIKEFAEKINVSYSTMTRMIAKKYIQTDYGIYPLKHFFDIVKDKKNSQTENKTEYSKNKVINLIRKIIEDEGEEPYTDEQIVEILKEKGYIIARRTISKYRNLMGILPANKRKHLRREYDSKL